MGLGRWHCVHEKHHSLLPNLHTLSSTQLLCSACGLCLQPALQRQGTTAAAGLCQALYAAVPWLLQTCLALAAYSMQKLPTAVQ